jgi:fatty acid desaturase
MAQLKEQEHPDTKSELTDREWARARVEKKHKLRADFVAYVVINAALVVVWALTGSGYFWPGWVLGIWGVFLLLDAWNVYYRRPVTDEEIYEELRRQR